MMEWYCIWPCSYMCKQRRWNHGGQGVVILTILFRLLESHKGHPEVLSADCMDPLGRSALVMAIENENYDLIQLLLDEGVKVKVIC